jgi:uncharacterized protein
MHCERDDRKDRRNRLKHHVGFETAALVFDDPHALSVLDRIEHDEERWQTIGMAARILLLLVAHTYRSTEGDERIRIFSARKATPRERQIYEENF